MCLLKWEVNLNLEKWVYILVYRFTSLIYINSPPWIKEIVIFRVSALLYFFFTPKHQSHLFTLSSSVMMLKKPLDLKSQFIGKDPDVGQEQRLGTGGEGGNRRWDRWISPPTQWTWVWSNSRRQWRIGKPGMLQSMGSQRARHDLVTKQHL